MFKDGRIRVDGAMFHRRLEEEASGGRGSRKGVVVVGEESSGFRKGLHFERLRLLESGRGH